MARDINKERFPEETELKLKIFAECFREWLPVFLHDKYTTSVYIYDFFAGSGKDGDNHLGSPLILLNEAKGDSCKHCQSVERNGKHLCFAFNEKMESKQKLLVDNVERFMDECAKVNCKKSSCIYSYKNFEQKEFKELWQSKNFNFVLQRKDYGKFILLDQYGFSQVDEDVFLKLVSSPKTDFIFFISSSFIKRFKEHPNTKQYFATEKINFDGSKANECHRLIADYYQSLIPQGKEYYLHNFTIQKGANYWGLIFGSNHTLGMEKFLKVCWSEGNDPHSGESNCNVDGDFEIGTLFYTTEETNKKLRVKNEIRSLILSRGITDNISGLKYALKKRCLPELFTSVVKELEREGLICRTGELNYSSVNIHRVKRYDIKVISK